MAMMAITTSNSISVKPRREGDIDWSFHVGEEGLRRPREHAREGKWRAGAPPGI
jgi:hypothetical protein